MHETRFPSSSSLLVAADNGSNARETHRGQSSAISRAIVSLSPIRATANAMYVAFDAAGILISRTSSSLSKMLSCDQHRALRAAGIVRSTAARFRIRSTESTEVRLQVFRIVKFLRELRAIYLTLERRYARCVRTTSRPCSGEITVRSPVRLLFPIRNRYRPLSPTGVSRLARPVCPR